MIHLIGIWLQQIDSDKPCALRLCLGDRSSLSRNRPSLPDLRLVNDPSRPMAQDGAGARPIMPVGGSVALSEDLQVRGLHNFNGPRGRCGYREGGRGDSFPSHRGR